MCAAGPGQPLPAINSPTRAAPRVLDTGAPSAEPGRLEEAGHAFWGGGMSVKPEAREPGGGAFPMGGDLNGGGCAWPEDPERVGVQAEPLDVLKLPGVLDAGVALVVCLGPLPRGSEAALSAIFCSLSAFSFAWASIEAFIVRAIASSLRRSSSKASLILFVGG